MGGVIPLCGWLFGFLVGDASKCRWRGEIKLGKIRRSKNEYYKADPLCFHHLGEKNVTFFGTFFVCDTFFPLKIINKKMYIWIFLFGKYFFFSVCLCCVQIGNGYFKD